MRNIAIRDFQDGDVEGISSLFETVFHQPLSPAHWNWKYRDSWSHRVLSRVALDDSGTLVAHVGAVALRGLRTGRPIPFLQICDIMVHPQARGFLGRKNLYARLVGGFFTDLGAAFPNAFCYGFPGERPFKLGRYMGLYDAVEEAREAVWTAEVQPAAGPRWREADWGDPRIERIWGRYRRTLRMGLIRDAEYLQWRYADNPVHPYRLLLLGGRLWVSGYAVVREVSDTLWVMELLVPNRRLEQHALRGLAEYAKRRGLDRVGMWITGDHRPAIDAQIRPSGLVATNVVRGFPTRTCELVGQLAYSRGDVDMY